MNIIPYVSEQEWTVEDVPVLTAEISLPLPSEGQKRMDSFYRLQHRSFLRYCRMMLLPQAESEYRIALQNSKPIPCFRAALDYQMTYQDDRLLSLYTQTREPGFTGQSHLRQWGDTWDLETGYPVPLWEFLPHMGKKQILNMVSGEIQKQERSRAARYHEKWRQLIRRFNPRNYYLSPEGIHIFYPMGLIAPFGIPTFCIPWETKPSGALHTPDG